MQHLAVFIKGVIDLILAGQKTIESRFSKFQFAPYKRVKTGDEIFMKESGGKVKGRFSVGNVLFFSDLSPQKLGEIRREYGDELKVGKDFWEDKKGARYATLIFIKTPAPLANPLQLDKHDKRAWVVLSDVPGVSSRLQMSLRFSDRDSLRSLEELLTFIEKETGQSITHDARELMLVLAARVGNLAQKIHKRKGDAPIGRELAEVFVELLRLARRENLDLFKISRERIMQESKLSLENLAELKK
jgi:predicted transcriptional regulator